MRGLCRSRAEAQDIVDDGVVTVNGRVALKPSEAVGVETQITVSDNSPRWVSRGAIKLDAALSQFGVNVSEICALDVGAATGGFTECLLRRGAAHVHALDVGHGQMVPALTSDPRVTLYEGVNARFLTPSDFPYPFPLIVVDVSFISLTLIIPALAALMTSSGDLLCLVKPQFEVGAGKLDHGGIVRDPALREQALERVVTCAIENGFMEARRMTSPITGTNGNVEFLVWLKFVAGTEDKHAE